MTTRQFRLEEAYTKLTFKWEGTPDDVARIEAFMLLLGVHLISKDILDLQEFEKLSKRDSSIAEFITLYGKQLWPGSVAARQHLANPELKNSGKPGKGSRTGAVSRRERSFVASFDGRWTAKTSGRKSDKPKPSTVEELAAMSKIGRALRNFIEVMLEVPIDKKRYWGIGSVEDICAKATKVGDGAGEGKGAGDGDGEEDGRRSPTMEEIERDLGIGADTSPPGDEEMEFGSISEDEDDEMWDPSGYNGEVEQQP